MDCDRKKMLKEVRIKRVFFKEQCLRSTTNIFTKAAYNLVIEELDDLIKSWENSAYRKCMEEKQ